MGAFLELAAIKFSAAIQAGDRASNWPDPRELLSAARTCVKVTPGAALHRKRQGVGARFVADPQIAASLSPFGAVRRKTAAAGAKLGQEMGQFVSQSAVDLARIVFAQTRIKRDQRPTKIGPAGRAEKPGIPFDLHVARQFGGAQGLQQFPGFGFEREVAPEHDERWTSWKNEIELSVIRLIIRFRGAAVCNRLF